MQGHKHFRIVCLKNEGSNRGVSERNRHTNIVMSDRSEIRFNNKVDVQPSLAYLSARLQDEVKSSGISNVSSVRQTSIKENYCNSIKIINRTEQISLKKEKPLFKQTLDVEKYFERKQLFLDGSKNTMRHLIGSIDFQLHKKKEKLISRAIKSTINENGLGHRKNRLHSKNAGLENRTFMEGDFHSFLANKQREKIKLEKQLEQNQSQVQLLKLMVMNPEKIEDMPSGQNMHPSLNLFHFQKTQGKEKRTIRSNNSMGSKLHIETSAADRKMIQKKMFEKKMFWLRPTLKTDAEDFEWSRMDNHKYTVEVKDK